MVWPELLFVGLRWCDSGLEGWSSCGQVCCLWSVEGRVWVVDADVAVGASRWHADVVVDGLGEWE